MSGSGQNRRFCHVGPIEGQKQELTQRPQLENCPRRGVPFILREGSSPPGRDPHPARRIPKGPGEQSK